MDISGDTRGVSEVLGAILVFGLVLSLLVLVQTLAVPAANERVEFDHSKQVENDLGEFDQAIDRAAYSGSSEGVSIKTGVQYPNRFLLLNPPNPGGQIRTVSAGSDAILLENVKASTSTRVGEEAEDYWDGTDRSFRSAVFSYEPDYNRYQNAPTTQAEYGILYNTFSDSKATVVRDTGGIVRGNDIRLTALNGSLSTSSSGTEKIQVMPRSGPAKPVTITNPSSGGPINITLKTQLNESVWVTKVLAGEFDKGASPSDCSGLVTGGLPDPDDGQYVTGCWYEEGSSFNEITIRFEKGQEYNLWLSDIALKSTQPQNPVPGYIVPANEAAEVASASGEARVTAEVRDRYNNPRSNVEVTFSPVGSSTQKSSRTQSDGLASATFSVAGDTTVLAFYDGSFSDATRCENDARCAVLEIDGRLVNADLDNGTSDDGVSAINYPLGSVVLDGIAFDGTNVTLRLNNTANDTRRITRSRLPFYYADQGTGSTRSGPDYGDFDGNPNDRMEVTGPWENIDSPVAIPRGGTKCVTIEFSGNAQQGDFFIDSMLFDDGAHVANYFVAIPSTSSSVSCP